MNKIRSRNTMLDVKSILAFFFFIFFTISLCVVINFKVVRKGYSIFIEFNNAHGIKRGTKLRIRGIHIGSVKNVKIDYNSIIVLAHIQSSKILIPKNSIIETNQTGLLNESIIDIIPLENIKTNNIIDINLFSSKCLKSKFICHLSYLEGDRGLNYDDLVRATTRISQRFDDPRFFNLFYIFLQNSIDVSDSILDLTIDISDIISIVSYSMYKFFQIHFH